MKKKIKFKNKVKLPFFNSFSFFTYLEKSPKFTIKIEKKVKKVPATVVKAIRFSFENNASFLNKLMNDPCISEKFSEIIMIKKRIKPK